MSEQKRPAMRPGGGGRGPMRVNLDKAKDAKGTAKRLLTYMHGQKKLLVIAFIFIVLYVVCNLGTTVLLQPIIDNAIIPMLKDPSNSELKTEFIKRLGIYLGVTVGTVICTYVQSRIMLGMSQKIVKRLRDEVFAKIQKLPIKYFDTHPHGELMSRIVNDIDNISMCLKSSICQIISGALVLIGTLV